MKVNNVEIIGLIEIRVKENIFEKILKKMFGRYKGIVNYFFRYNGRIWVFWNDFDWDV